MNFVIFLLCFYGCCADSLNLTFKYVTVYNKEGRLMTNEDLRKDSVNVLKPIIFVLNGYNGSEDEWVNALIGEYLEKQVHNVFQLNLNEIKEENPAEAQLKITEALVEFIQQIYVKTGEEYLHFRLISTTNIGFDIAMNAGWKISNHHNSSTGVKRKIDRITGLDPTYPNYNISTKNQYENILDEVASFVDVVHSNVHKFLDLERYGHVDFYIDDINCRKESDSNCGYLNAIKLYKRSINSEKITALKCNSLRDFDSGKCAINDAVLFGENLPNNANGVYILPNESRR